MRECGIQLRYRIICRSSNIEDDFLLDNGQALSLSDIPAEFQPFFNAVYGIATDFQSVADWDAASFATLIVLQFLNTNGKQCGSRECTKRLFQTPTARE